MRLVRIAVVVGLALVGVGISGSPAVAGGAVFEFPRDSYLPGEVASGVSKDVSIRIQTSAKPQDGPFFASISRVTGPLAYYPHGTTRAGRRMPVGPVSFTKTGPGFVTARITFRVPDVPHGTYAIEMCNRPCTDRFVGDLVGGWFYVGTPLEYQVRALRARLSEQKRLLHGQEHRIRMFRSDMEAEVAAVERRLGGDLAEMRRRVREQSEGSTPLWAIFGWAGAALVATILMVVVRRRRVIAVDLPRLPDGRLYPDYEPSDRR